MQPRIDFDVVHTAEVVLVRIYYRNRLNVLSVHSEVKLSAGADFPNLYDTFRREYKWPSTEEMEGDVLQRYKGNRADRSALEENDRTEHAARDLAEFFKVWLVLRGKGEVLSHEATP